MFDLLLKDIKELETGYVVIGDYQHFKGYTLFLYKDHVVELFDLEYSDKNRPSNEELENLKATLHRELDKLLK